MLKDEYPEVIADLLGIPPIAGKGGPWMSTEGTVLKDWLLAIGEALDVPYAGDKTSTMRALVEATGIVWDEATMTSLHSRTRGGGNISKAGFEALYEGLRTLPTSRVEALGAESEDFLPTEPDADTDRVVLRAMRDRAGQPQFRADLLEAYGGRCAVSGWDAPAALEAAHVVPYGLHGTYALANGLLLRADLHTLFDKGLLAFTGRRRVTLHSSLSGTAYATYLGVELRDPRFAVHRVPTASLDEHRVRSGL